MDASMAKRKNSTPPTARPKPLPSQFSRLYPLLIVVLLSTAAGLAFIALREPTHPVVHPPALASPAPPQAKPPIAQGNPPAMVDEALCAGCHAAQSREWQGTHHQLAMQAADDSTVLGDFADVTFQGETETTRFFRRGQEFWVNAPDDAGAPRDFKVAYTFGVAPLQQYLLQTTGGALQPLGVAWDTEQQRWFHLYPGQGVDFKDPLHWSKPGQNANFMCIECHTTGFKRNFDPDTATFSSTWNSLGAGCQSCHGPASNHLAWAKAPASAAQYSNAGLAVDMRAPGNTLEVETCARCHARRAPLGDGQLTGKPLMDAYLPSALTAELYEPDGKIKGEVFEHGSFVQSKMFAKGVRCSDCHNPHSTALKAPGNGVCLQCHNPSGRAAVARVDGSGLQAKNYDSPEHHHHEAAAAGSQCVDCHMPGKLFMVNDLRHDHSFTLPNPAFAQAVGGQDACITCHKGMPANELAARFKQWFGGPASATEHYAQALWQARSALPGAAQALFSQLDAPLVSAIRRTTLLNELPDYPSQSAVDHSIKALRDPAAQVREAAVRVIATQLPMEQRLDVLGPLLGDGILAVRIASARALLGLQGGHGHYQPAFDKAIREYEQVQLSLQERAEANLNLALLYQAQGQAERVEPYLRTAIKRDADFYPAWVTLVQWLDARQRQDESWALLSQKIGEDPNVALLQFTKGLALVRRNQPADALQALREANRLEPSNARFAYVLALTLQERGDLEGAKRLLVATLQQHPQNRDVRMALVAHLRDEGDVAAIKAKIEELKAINPGDPILNQ
jgi:predicted CXXCH cytochrome family protein